jgi:Fe-S oxidoreductase
MPLQRAQSFGSSAIEKAATCLECGECVSRCPYHLDIPALLKESVKLWGGDGGVKDGIFFGRGLKKGKTTEGTENTEGKDKV